MHREGYLRQKRFTQACISSSFGPKSKAISQLAKRNMDSSQVHQDNTDLTINTILLDNAVQNRRYTQLLPLQACIVRYTGCSCKWEATCPEIGRKAWFWNITSVYWPSLELPSFWDYFYFIPSLMVCNRKKKPWTKTKSVMVLTKRFRLRQRSHQIQICCLFSVRSSGVNLQQP